MASQTANQTVRASSAPASACCAVRSPRLDMTSSRARVRAYLSPNSAAISSQNSLCRTAEGSHERQTRHAGVRTRELSGVAGTITG